MTSKPNQSNKSSSKPTEISLNIAVITVSDSRTPANDTSGDYLNQAILDAGHQVNLRSVVPNSIWHIRQALCQLLVGQATNVIILNGGTGFTHDKATIPAVKPLLDNTITGFGEMFRYLSHQDIGSSALQSDAIGGLANNTLVFCIPGSPGACRLAWEGILRDQLNSTQKPCNFATMFR